MTLEPGLNVIEIVGPPVTSSSSDDALIPLIRVRRNGRSLGPRAAHYPLRRTGVGESLDCNAAAGSSSSGHHPVGGRVVVSWYSARRTKPFSQQRSPCAGSKAAKPDPNPHKSRRFPTPAQAAGRDISLEILLHIERVGDRQFPGQGWVGPRGEKRRIEAFGIRPLGGIWPRDIHYKALHAGGVETPWIPGPQLCGTRGRGLPLLGFAIRVAPHLQAKYEIVYQGAFFQQRHCRPEPQRGARAVRPLPTIPLEAMNIRVIERAAE